MPVGLTYDLSSYANPNVGYFAAEDQQPSYFYFTVCEPLTQVTCPNPESSRARQLEAVAAWVESWHLVPTALRA